jgi:hypothetical protein
VELGVVLLALGVRVGVLLLLLRGHAFRGVVLFLAGATRLGGEEAGGLFFFGALLLCSLGAEPDRTDLILFSSSACEGSGRTGLQRKPS